MYKYMGEAKQFITSEIHFLSEQCKIIHCHTVD